MFRVWAGLDLYTPLAEIPDAARRAEAIGFDGVMVTDVITDGFLAAQAAIGATREIRVATAAIVCFPRSPMTVAVAAWNLQALSGGRFHLGLGPLVRGNIVHKYSTPWSAPAPRMREYVQALRAIFGCWQYDTPLDFRGRHYQFTRMQRFVRPLPIEHPHIPIHLAGIGPRMTALAGEIADALVTHTTNTSPRFLREVTLPAIARGAARAQRAASDLELIVNALYATGKDAAAVQAQREQQRRLLAILYSTPSYWPTLDLHGWRDRGEYLHSLVRQDRWDEMPSVVTDEMLDILVPAAPYPELAGRMREAYGSLTDTLSLALPRDPADDAALAALVAELHSA